MRVHTTYVRIMNEYEYYKKIEKNGFDSIKKEIIEITKLNEKDWLDIKQTYENENKESEDEESDDATDDESE